MNKKDVIKRLEEEIKDIQKIAQDKMERATLVGEIPTPKEGEQNSAMKYLKTLNEEFSYYQGLVKAKKDAIELIKSLEV